MRGGEPRYVTASAAATSPTAGATTRRDGGVVIDVRERRGGARAGCRCRTRRRLHRGRLWLLDSGTGRFGCVEPGSGRFEPVCFCPGYARGLAFVGDFAVIGLSLPAAEPHLHRPAARRRAGRARGAEPRCGLLVVDLRTGDAVHWLRDRGRGRRALRRRRHAGRDPPDGARLPDRRDPSADHHCPGGRLSRSDRANLRREGI